MYTCSQTACNLNGCFTLPSRNLHVTAGHILYQFLGSGMSSSCLQMSCLVTEMFLQGLKGTCQTMLHGNLHVPFTDLHGLRQNHRSQKASRDPSRTLHGPSRIARTCQLWKMPSRYPSRILHGPSRTAALWDWHVLESVTRVLVTSNNNDNVIVISLHGGFYRFSYM